MEFLEVQGLCLHRNGTPAVDDIGFTLAAKSRLAIAGETGSGKSSLLRMIAGLEQPDFGRVYFEGKRVKGPNEVLIPGCKGIGYLSQYFELRNHYRVRELLEMVNLLESDTAALIMQLCEVDLLLERWSHALSGGEKQRVALAAVLLQQPRLLLLDEPFSNADPIHKAHMKQVLARVEAEMHVTVVLVAHDPADVLPWATHLLLLREGKLEQQGSPLDLYHQPVNSYCAGLLGSYSLLQIEPLLPWLPLQQPLPAGKRLLLRPGNLQTGARPGGYPATVQSVLFYGDYYLLTVQMGEQFAQVLHRHRPPAPGDEVFVHYTSHAPCFIDVH